MLKIYTGNNSESLKGIKAKYEFPENGLSGWEQIDWMEEKLEEFKGDNEVVVKTFSPYILNYLNLWLARGDMGYENLEAFEMFLDETLEEPFETSLKILNEGVKLIDTRSLSDLPIFTRNMIKKNCLSCKYGYDFYRNTCKCFIESADSNTKCTDLPRDNCPNYKEELQQIYWKRVWRLKGEVVTDNYTTQSQSRELLKHGLDPNTADMIWTYDFMAGEVTCINIISDLLKPESPDIPAWSLSQLLNMLPEKIVIGEFEYHLKITKHGVRYILEGKEIFGFGVESEKDGLLDCLVKMIIQLLDKGTQINGNILSC